MSMQQLPYGDFDCEVNAITILFGCCEMSFDPLYRFNYDLHYDEEEELFRGTAPLDSLLVFMKRSYGIQFKELKPLNVPIGSSAILAANAYHLPFAQDYYMKHRLVHYFVARRESVEQFEVYDPIFRYSGQLSAQLVDDSAVTIDRLSLLAYQMPLGSIRSKQEEPAPFLVQLNDASRISEAISKFQDRLPQILEAPDPLFDDYLFKKYFGNLQSILQSRIRHFATPYANRSFGELPDLIIAAWKKTIKSYMKMGVNRKQGCSETLESLHETGALEMQYCESFKSQR
jgi:hypothetical protein